MDVWLIRHGETESNAARRYQGRTDEPLSARGRERLLKAGQDQTAAQVWVSPMLRARQTAEILFPNAAQSVEKDLREMDFGDFEGRTALEMRADPAYCAWVESGCADRCPNGEALADFQARVCDGFFRILRRHDPSQTLLVVAHGGTLMALMGALGLPKRAYWEWGAANGEGLRAELQWAADGPALCLREELKGEFLSRPLR